MITDAQANAIRMTELLNAEIGYTFTTLQIHPDRTAQGNGKRRALRSLVKHGLIAECNEYGDLGYHGYYKVIGNIKAAYDEWLKDHGFKFV